MEQTASEVPKGEKVVVPSRDIGMPMRVRQLEVLYDQAPVALAASLAAALILIALFWPVTPRLLLLSWFALLVLVTALRSALIRSYRRVPAKAERTDRWKNWFVVGSASAGLLWGVAIILFPPPASIFHTGLAVLWVCGLTAGSVVALSSVRSGFFSFAIPALVPAALYLLISGQQAEALISGAIFLFLGFLSFNALRTHRTTVETLQLQFDNAELIAHLDAEKERIETLNEQLEQRVRERTAELAAANAAKSRFLAAASHDLRQPLQTLSLLTGVLSRTVGDLRAAQTIQEMQDTLRIMGTLLDALLDINKLDSGAIKPELKDFSIGTLLDRLRLDFNHHSGEKGLSLHVVPSSAIVRSDATLLENIVRNLLANAIRYTDEGKILLGCRRRGDRLRIEVWDTGIGIPKTHIERIFEEFYQLDNPARDRSKGLGLGLAVVQRSARLLGHAVEVQSCPDKGSVFAVEVPLGSSEEQPDDQAKGGAVDDAQRRAASILLVEDEAVVLEITKSFLELDGYRVHPATNADAAARLVQLREMKPDLIITDYRLPQSRTGIEVIQLIRDHVALDVPGIVLTGDTSPAVAQEAQAHRVRILHKPAHPEELSALIRQLLKEAERSESGLH